MRFPSLRLVGEQTRAVAARFPFVVAAAVTATVGAVLLFDGTSPHWSVEARILLTGGLGIPLLLAAALWLERWPGRTGQILANGLTVLLLAGFFLAWPRWTEEVGFRRYVQLTLAAHLLASFVPFARGHQLQGFWQYNKTLLLRFLASQLFAHVLFLGLVVALVALDQLFGVDIPDRLYGRLWAVTAIGFATLYFLGGIPRLLDSLDTDTSYPPAMKVLAQYILLPIVMVYLVILTAYLGKVLITRVWPSGWIGYLVSSVSLLGVFSLLLLFPIQHRQENRWVSTYGRLLYVALLPSLGMLLAAVGKRVDQYGVTENRYFLLVLAVWLGGVCIFHLVTRSRDIRWIPMSLCAVALVTSFGPWDAYDVSRRDQLDRLAECFARNGMLVEGHAVAASEPVSFEDRQQMSAVLTYLLSTHGAHSVKRLLSPAWDVLDPEPTRHTGRFHVGSDLAQTLLAELDVTYVERWERPDLQNRVVSFTTLPGSSHVLDVEGYEYLVHVQEAPVPEGAPRPEYTIAYDGSRDVWTLRDRDQQPRITIPLDDVVAAMGELHGIESRPRPRPVVVESTEGGRWKLVVYSLFVDENDSGRRTASIDARLLFTVD